jgi:hypothetical protein
LNAVVGCVEIYKKMYQEEDEEYEKEFLDESVINNFAAEANMKAIRKCFELGFPQSKDTCFSLACFNKYSYIEECILDLGFEPTDEKVCLQFARNNEMLYVEKCAKHLGFRKDAGVCLEFARHKNIKAIERCLFLGFPKDPEMFDEFKRQKNSKALKQFFDGKRPDAELENKHIFQYPANYEMKMTKSNDLTIEIKEEYESIMNRNCVNFIDMDESNSTIGDYLAKNKNNIVILDEKYKNAIQTTRTEILDIESEHIYYPCISKGRTTTANQDEEFHKLNLESFCAYVPEEDLNRLLFRTNCNIFMVIPTKLNIMYTASQKVIDGGNYVSANHCQEGTEKQIFHAIGVDTSAFSKHKIMGHNNNNVINRNSRSDKRRRSGKRQRNDMHDINEDNIINNNNNQRTTRNSFKKAKL